MQNELSEVALNFLTAISFYKNTGDMERAAGKLSGEWQERFEDVLKAYESERTRKGVIDFDDMVYECRELLNHNSKLCRYWQGRFDAILIDEFHVYFPHAV